MHIRLINDNIVYLSNQNDYYPQSVQYYTFF